MFIINSIAPIFLLIALGKVLQRTGFLPDAFFKGLNRLVFWFALPALLTSSISEAALELAIISRIVLLLTGGTLLAMLTAWIISRRLSLPAPKTGSFIQGSFRGNGAFIALPVILYSFGTQDVRTQTMATVVLAPAVILFNILGVLVLSHYRRDRENAGISIKGLIMELARNPLILACATGIGLNAFGLHLPLWLFRPLDALGHAALPLVLMSIGAGLEVEKLRRGHGQRRPARRPHRRPQHSALRPHHTDHHGHWVVAQRRRYALVASHAVSGPYHLAPVQSCSRDP